MAIGKLLGWHYVLYTAFGYSVAILVSFTLNRYFTFQAQGNGWVFLTRFLGVNLINLGMVQFLQLLLIGGLGLPELPCVAVAMVIYTVAGYFANRELVFKKG